jgi:Glycerol dehydrogenase and related enzymes
MLRAMKFPAAYFQGRDALTEFEIHTRCYGKSFLFIGSKSALKAARGKLESSFAGSEGSISFELSTGTPCASEIARLKAITVKIEAQVICAVGGGGVMDIVRSIAMSLGRPMIMIPTSVASDAPCTYVSVIYSEDGSRIVGDEQFYKCPDLVYVDSSIVADAPVRLIVSGMGDALATVYEATSRDRYNIASGGSHAATGTAMMLCRESRALVMKHGYLAYVAAQNHAVTPDLERIIEANCFLSGVGGLNTGCSGAHGFGDFLSTMPGGHNFLHGERVMIGLIIQLVMENYPKEEIDSVIRFAHSVGLPLSVRDLGINDLEAAAQEIGAATENDHFIVNLDCDHSAEVIRGAVLTAAALVDEIRKGTTK